MRRATGTAGHARPATEISIHALLAESDAQILERGRQSQAISIHALLAESDGSPRTVSFFTSLFLSTLSLRRATIEKVPADVYYQAFLSTLSLRRATWAAITLREVLAYFYPRSPCGERQKYRLNVAPAQAISIHALLAESDLLIMLLMPSMADFYPRSPCGERPNTKPTKEEQTIFLSTLSLRRATQSGGTGI